MTPANWFDLHPKVKAALIGVGLVVLASSAAATNNDISWHSAFLEDAAAAFTFAMAWLKTEEPVPPVPPVS